MVTASQYSNIHLKCFRLGFRLRLQNNFLFIRLGDPLQTIFLRLGGFSYFAVQLFLFPKQKFNFYFLSFPEFCTLRQQIPENSGLICLLYIFLARHRDGFYILYLIFYWKSSSKSNSMNSRGGRISIDCLNISPVLQRVRSRDSFSCHT